MRPQAPLRSPLSKFAGVSTSTMSFLIVLLKCLFPRGLFKILLPNAAPATPLPRPPFARGGVNCPRDVGAPRNSVWNLSS